MSKYKILKNTQIWKYQNIKKTTFSFPKAANCTSQFATTFRFTVTEICRQIVKWMAPFKVGSHTGTEVRDEKYALLVLRQTTLKGAFHLTVLVLI